MKKDILFIFFIFLFSLFGMKALFHPSLFSAHDIWHQVARLYHYQQAFLDGQFPPYWIGGLAGGFGYPLFFFSYHLPWIMALPFLILGLTIENTLKTLFFLSFFLSGVFMYFFASTIFKRRLAGFLAATIYLFSPYRFLTILVSAAIGTSFIFVFLPLFLWGIYLLTESHKKGILLTTLGLAGMILSHLMTVISIIPLSIIFICHLIYQQKQKKLFLKNLSLGIIIGLLLSAFYLFPAVFYNSETQVSTGFFKEIYKQNFVNLSQLIYSKWGYGLNQVSAKQGAVPYQIGAAIWLSLLLLIILYAIKRMPSFGLALIIVFLMSVLAMVDLSRPVWDLISKIITPDYPTMFLLPVTFSGSLMAAFVFVNLKKPYHLLFLIILISLAIYANRNHLRVNMYTDIPISLYAASELTTNSYHEYLPKKADIKLFSENSNYVVLPRNLMVSNFKQTTRQLSFSINLKDGRDITIKHFAFPGMNSYIDDKKIDYKVDEMGRIKLSVPQGKHDIIIKFEDTPIIILGKILTLMGLLSLIYLTYGKKT